MEIVEQVQGEVTVAYHRAIETTGKSQSGISLLRFGRANDSGDRGGEHDPQKTSEVCVMKT
jgi:hypothetical protein